MSRLNKSAFTLAKISSGSGGEPPARARSTQSVRTRGKRGCGGWLNPRLCQRSNGWPKEAIVFNRIRLRFDEITASIRIVTI